MNEPKTQNQFVGQWGKTPTHVLTSQLSDTAKVMFCYMAAKVSAFTWPIYTDTRGYTATKLGWSDSKVRRAQRELVMARQIGIESRRPGKSVYYRVYFEEPAQLGPYWGPSDKSLILRSDPDPQPHPPVTDGGVMNDRHPSHLRHPYHKMFPKEDSSPPLTPLTPKRDRKKVAGEKLDKAERLKLDLKEYGTELHGTGLTPSLSRTVDKALFAKGAKSYAHTYDGLLLYVEDFVRREISLIQRLLEPAAERKNSGASSVTKKKELPDLDWSQASPPPPGFTRLVDSIGKKQKRGEHAHDDKME